MSVLIVTDSTETRQHIQSLLEARGYSDVLTENSGQAALKMLESANPDSPNKIDVVLAEAEMPGLNGIELCRRTKAVKRLHDIPVLILTAHPDRATLEDAFAAEVCDYVVKPIEENALVARMRAAVHLKGQLDNCSAREHELLDATQQLKRLNEELQRLSILDELTGIANRRFFNILFRQEWGRATREVLPLSLILIDIDFFKNYNDYYGHPQGDKCLGRVASTLNTLTRRPGDSVARYGGEEFVVLLAHTGMQGARSVAETLRQSIEGLCLQHPASSVHDRVTISLGVATTVPERGHSAEVLLAAADQAVYQAKHEGRNRVKVYQGPLDGEGQTGSSLSGPHRPENLATPVER